MAKIFTATNKKKASGQIILLDIERLDANGCGVGRYKKKPVFVENSLPNEQVKVKIIEAKGKFYKAKVVEYIAKSEHRVEPLCRHFKSCGGCDLQHLNTDEQLVFKQQKVSNLFARENLISHLPWQPAIVSQPWHYRRKARIGVQYSKNGEPIVGFRQKQSNTLTPIKQCNVLVEPLHNVFTELSDICRTLTLPKSIGHIEVIATEKVSIVIRQLIQLNKHDRELWLAKASEHQWQVFIDDGKSVSALTPAESLAYRLCSNSINPNDKSNDKSIDYDVTIRFEPKDFIQINHGVNENMIFQALQWLSLTKDDVVLDLFCGLGNFSLPIAQQVKKVVGVEGVQSMVNKATTNAASNNLTNIQFFQADLNASWSEHEWSQHKYTKVLLDPARAGAFDAIQQLLLLNIKTIVYVSCDPATLAKDSHLLVENGYNIQKISIMDMFVHTKHIETMVLFTKA